MQYKVLLRGALVLTLGALLHSCGTSKTLYSWGHYEDRSYAVAKSPSEKHLRELIQVYDELTRFPKGTRGVPPPGMCAEYGYLLIKRGETQRGRKLLEQELTLYPESAVFIRNLLKRIP